MPPTTFAGSSCSGHASGGRGMLLVGGVLRTTSRHFAESATSNILCDSGRVTRRDGLSPWRVILFGTAGMLSDKSTANYVTRRDGLASWRVIFFVTAGMLSGR